MATIEYRTDADLSVDEFQSLLRRSTLGDRRPIEDLPRLQGMLDHSNLVITAWKGGQLVGIARSMTDFHFACYLSDLAVDQAFQRQGIGRRLQQITQEKLGPQCSLILLSAPDARGYYPKLGYESSSRCWILPSGRMLE